MAIQSINKKGFLIKIFNIYLIKETLQKSA